MYYLALHWIQENIAEFGGDPGRVTLVGFGAGAACIHFLMTSPAVVNGKSKNYFFSFFFISYRIYIQYYIKTDMSTL